MDLALDGKVAIVTGAASGLGRRTAETMQHEGVSLMLADRDAATLDRTAAELSSGASPVRALAVDVRDYASCRELVETTVADLGQVDVLVNSAGIGGSMAFFADTEPSEWEDLIAINLVGVMNCCRAVTDHMVERRYGKIISIASEAGKANEKRMVVYGTTKGGVISLTRGMAAELGRYGINVNAVCPGVTHTAMTSFLTEEIEQEARKFYPLGRLGEPDDIAPLITFLASDKASWITGQAISINGGFGRS
jgi:2-hydroxycyclohexanecarboxyl-CoA dehydrogenase